MKINFLSSQSPRRRQLKRFRLHQTAPNMPIAFVAASPTECSTFTLCVSNPALQSSRRRSVCHHPPAVTVPHWPAVRCHPIASDATASQDSWTPPSSSSALDYDGQPNTNSTRYIDLRTMKVILPEDAHINPAPPSNNSFSPLGSFHLSALKPHDVLKLRQLLFTNDTIPLSDSQKDVVYALLSHRSVLYTSVTTEEKHGVFLDIVMRSRVWKKCTVYCTSSRRSAEAVFTMLCAQLGTDRRNEILLDLGDGSPQRGQGSSTKPDDSLRVVITSRTVLRNAIVNLGSESWLENASILFIDSISDTSIKEWEEILLSLPSNILLCLLSSHLTRAHLELLPIWIETIQNTTSIITPLGTSNILSRIERPQNTPLLRTFAYNAAVHQFPVQVSLTILKELLQKEIDQSNKFDFIPDYAQAFLNGITMIPAADPKELLFRSPEEAMYADFSALIVADAERTESSNRSKSKRRNRNKKKERTPSSRAAARRRRETAYSNSMLLPANILVKGHKEAVQCAEGIASALGSIELLWDEDTKDHVESIVESLMQAHDGELTPLDAVILNLLRVGIGVITDFYTPSVRLTVEELFRSGIIGLLVCDTHLGSEELCVLPSGKSVIIEARSLATCDDTVKGLLAASTAASLSGRPGKDDVGNMVVLWYDESVDDETAGYEIATNLLSPELNDDNEPSTMSVVKPYTAVGKGFSQPFGNFESYELRRGLQSAISSSYDTVLRSLLRFGIDGYKSLYEYTLSSFKGWLNRAALHATLEKLEVERTAINERLGSEDWNVIADYERKTAKLNEVTRMLNAMTSRMGKVLERKMLLELKSSPPGRIIRIRVQGQSRNGKKKILNAAAASTARDGLTETASEQTSEKDDEEKDKTDIDIDDSQSALKLINGDRSKSDQFTRAAFVTIFDQEEKGSRVINLESQYLVVCVTADGLWTMIPLSHVDALAKLENVKGNGDDKGKQDDDDHIESTALISNVDLLMTPHPATFDVEPGKETAKCAPVDEGEQASLHRVSDELIARMTSEPRLEFETMEVPEFEKQRAHAMEVQKLHASSAWHGRDEELKKLRWLRRRAAEMGDEMDALRKQKEHFEELITESNDDRLSVQKSLMAVLEDCHALTFQRDTSIEMTPIGSLATILPCEYPLFASACACLINDIETLNEAEFAAFIAVVVCVDRSWVRDSLSKRIEKAFDEEGKGEDEDLEPIEMLRRQQSKTMRKENDMYGNTEINSSNNHKKTEGWDEDRQRVSMEAEALKGVLPTHVSEMVVEIQLALQQLHRRHLSECQAVQRVWVTDVVPKELNHRMAQALHDFVSGESWGKVCRSLDNESGYAIRQLRRVSSVAEIIWRDERFGEFTPKTKSVAEKAFRALNRWPVLDHDTVLDLLDGGVVERTWSGNTYDKWWRSTREQLKDMESTMEKKEVFAADGLNTVQSEVVDDRL